MKIGLPLPWFESEGLEDRNRQYHESGTDEAYADGFFVTFVHTAAKVLILSEKWIVNSEKLATARHFFRISSQIHHRLSQTRAEYPRYLEGYVIRPTFALRNV